MILKTKMQNYFLSYFSTSSCIFLFFCFYCLLDFKIHFLSSLFFLPVHGRAFKELKLDSSDRSGSSQHCSCLLALVTACHLTPTRIPAPTCYSVVVEVNWVRVVYLVSLTLLWTHMASVLMACSSFMFSYVHKQPSLIHSLPKCDSSDASLTPWRVNLSS